jgi:hypothetical protein
VVRSLLFHSTPCLPAQKKRRPLAVFFYPRAIQAQARSSTAGAERPLFPINPAKELTMAAKKKAKKAAKKKK